MTTKMEMKQMEARDMTSVELMLYTEAEYEECIEEFGQATTKIEEEGA